MVTHTQRPLNRQNQEDENRNLFWAAVAVALIALFAYAGYAAYYSNRIMTLEDTTATGTRQTYQAPTTAPDSAGGPAADPNTNTTNVNQ